MPRHLESVGPKIGPTDKPHIYLYAGAWVCTGSGEQACSGWSWTPAAAYAEWEQRYELRKFFRDRQEWELRLFPISPPPPPPPIRFLTPDDVRRCQ
jgi:hypothetical protein